MLHQDQHWHTESSCPVTTARYARTPHECIGDRVGLAKVVSRLQALMAHYLESPIAFCQTGDGTSMFVAFGGIFFACGQCQTNWYGSFFGGRTNPTQKEKWFVKDSV